MLTAISVYQTKKQTKNQQKSRNETKTIKIKKLQKKCVYKTEHHEHTTNAPIRFCLTRYLFYFLLQVGRFQNKQKLRNVQRCTIKRIKTGKKTNEILEQAVKQIKPVVLPGSSAADSAFMRETTQSRSSTSISTCDNSRWTTDGATRTLMMPNVL